MRRLLGRILRKIKVIAGFNKGDEIDTEALETLEAFKAATEQGFFDIQWYEDHCGKFETPFAGFKDYLNKSTFANVNPSALFDTETYLRSNLDIYHGGTSPLLHHMYLGRDERRHSSPAQLRWHPEDILVAEESPSWNKQKIAICLHIFYADFVEKFEVCLEAFPCNVDVFVAVSSEEIKQKVELSYTKIKRVNKLEIVVAPNRGRNFGPLLVEFAKDLLDYDLMCHLHSKKSLYSGREQTQWFDYLNQFLFKDQHVVNCVLRLFDTHSELGMYYPTSFWMMPSWVNHWTCNRPFAEDFIKSWGLDTRQNFINYPVGGMFWARPKALKQLLETDFDYEAFPEEPLPNDGSSLHALERVLGLLVEKNDYKQFYYYPPGAKFTTDKSYMFANYRKSPEQLLVELQSFDVVSFDVFDTVLRRKFTEPDYAKFKVGKYLTEQNIVSSPEVFVNYRNNAELFLRQTKYVGKDLSIVDVYHHLADTLGSDREQSLSFMQLEFEYDLELITGKDEMVKLVHDLSDLGREIWFITDTYYTQVQIEIMLRKIGVAVPYSLFVSSELGMRKDSGTMWHFIRDKINKEKASYIHVGDNVRSDAQICGDFGLANMHVLHPIDKWQASGFPPVLTDEQDKDEQEVLKWGKLISNQGRYPFFGE